MALKLIKVAKNFNVGLHTIVETLRNNGFPDVEEKPTANITDEMLDILNQEFKGDMAIKKEADKLARPVLKKEPVSATGSATPSSVQEPPPPPAPPVSPPEPEAKEPEESTPEKEKEAPEVVKRERPGLKVVGKIDLDKKPKKAAKKDPEPEPEPETPPVTEPVEEQPPAAAEAPETPEPEKEAPAAAPEDADAPKEAPAASDQR